ncbi:reverse transcriptase domain-containing protein [Citrus sinensis]|nr:reverse transcriptase domain-containing protein [Citrus sinensis]
MTARQVDATCGSFNFENRFVVDRNGMGGGLALFWSSDVNVTIKSYSSHHIDAIVQNQNGKIWRCTGIYGHAEASQKHHTWALLNRLAELYSYTWCCLGDFNEILYSHEKLGGNDRSSNMMLEFKESIRACNLMDMGFKGHKYTWSNRRYGVNFIEERLDRVLCSKDWGSTFQNLPAISLVNWVSDHCPIMFEVKDCCKKLNYKKNSFPRDHYEDMWSSYEACSNIVRTEWESFDGNSWESPVQRFQRKPPQAIDGEEIRKLEDQISNMLVDEEVYWKQRSRADWLKEGDKNTKFFHSKASARRRKNKIWGVEDDQGNWVDDPEGIEGEFCGFFQQLFTSSKPSQPQISEALKGLLPKVSQEMNTHLEEPFTPEEITRALSEMCPTKAPGPDGLPAAFFQKHWQIVGEGLTKTCLHILNEQGTLDSLNYTFIALIPKVEKPRKVMEFIPISLCNVVYRIVAKAIANRLKPILNHIISPNQSAFIPNRLITDNVIIGYECLHKIRHSKGHRNGLVALKLDISKAYDRVEWNFLEQTMSNLGFSTKWISLIMSCITTTCFSVLINGNPVGLIKPEKGLRQGCPLSPYLFILCAEAFSNLLHQAERERKIRGLKFAQDITITHLLFADDSLVFSKASIADCKYLKGIFYCYAKASGQIFNFEKSSMFFSDKATSEQISAIKSIFQLKVVPKYEKYLGLPPMLGRNKMSFFKQVKLKVTSKISSWHHKLFSAGGKEILIKAVAQAVPAYAMSVFKLPKGLCVDIQKEIARFWWGTKKDKHGIHWARWDSMSKAKCRGGLGFRDLSSFNQALVAKQGWRLVRYPNSSMARVMKARYYKNYTFWNAKVGSNPSFIWRSILWGSQVIKKGVRWRIGDGKNVLVYKDNWIPRLATFQPISPKTLPPETVVADLINSENKWRADKLEQHFMKEDIEAILKILLPSGKEEDEVLWHFDKKGEYSVKSGYQLVLNQNFPNEPESSNSSSRLWKIPWMLDLPEKVKIFMWRALKNILPTAENLWKRKSLQEPICQMCKLQVETVSHVLVECKAARKIWDLAPLPVQPLKDHNQDFFSAIQEMQSRSSTAEAKLMVVYCWVIWSPRNKFIFEGKKSDSRILAAKAESVLRAYQRVSKPGNVQGTKDRGIDQQKWKPPPKNVLKLNVDAAVNSKDQKTGLGAIVRDAEGKILAVGIKQAQFRERVSLAEAEAILWGLQVAKQVSSSSLIAESDCKEVVELLNNTQGSRTEIHWILSDVHRESKDFQQV